MNLTRSGYTGVAKYGTILWSGDICARWDVLRAQIAEALKMAMCGISHWTLDCGGFFVVRDAYDRRGCDCAAEAPNPLWFWRGDYNDGVKDPAYILSATYGIVVRTGLQCAPLLCARIGAAQGVVRASPGPFTTAQEGDALLCAVREISGGLP